MDCGQHTLDGDDGRAGALGTQRQPQAQTQTQRTVVAMEDGRQFAVGEVVEWLRFPASGSW